MSSGMSEMDESDNDELVLRVETDLFDEFHSDSESTPNSSPNERHEHIPDLGEAYPVDEPSHEPSPERSLHAGPHSKSKQSPDRSPAFSSDESSDPESDDDEHSPDLGHAFPVDVSPSTSKPSLNQNSELRLDNAGSWQASRRTHTTQETPSNIVGTTNAAARIKMTKNFGLNYRNMISMASPEGSSCQRLIFKHFH